MARTKKNQNVEVSNNETATATVVKKPRTRKPKTVKVEVTPIFQTKAQIEAKAAAGETIKQAERFYCIDLTHPKCQEIERMAYAVAKMLPDIKDQTIQTRLEREAINLRNSAIYLQRAINRDGNGKSN